MGDKLSQRQEQILGAIREFLRNYKQTPTVREIGDAVGLSSTCTVYRHLETLERRGFIRRDRGKARAIEIVAEEYAPPEIVEVPLLGDIAAGEPILAEENVTGWVPVSAEYLGAGQHFALKVRGESMIDDGIFDGDMVIIHQQETAQENDIVVAFTPHDVTGTATLKRFHREGDRIRLQPANSRMDPIYVSARDELRILGKAILAVRRL
ncbi:MAG: transcriptional repressor LexA [Armatimonadetes bacterium]|nr:transcriptional repressor LexA [Armatimonadota bacterium]